MNRFFLISIFFLTLLSCKTINYDVLGKNETVFTSVEIDTLFQDKISIRALVFDANKVWYAADKSRFGFFDLDKNEKKEQHIIKDSLKLEFRSIAKTSHAVFILSVSNPALLYRVSKDNLEPKLVYQENHEKVFYDSMQFWNDKEGIAIGDPIDDTSFCIILTRDGGNSWQKIPTSNLPKLTEGESAFAASNTNIVIKGNHTWIVSGGQKSRILYSGNKGITWSIYETPISQGEKMTGIFTADFYDAKIGFIAGGNYEIPNQNFDNKARTIDGGKSWNLIAQNRGFGYASCLQYVPNSNGKGIVVVGAQGLFYSSDGGVSWKQLATDPSLFTFRFKNDTTAIAAGKNKMIQIHFK
nr:oxidoreductase [uncultured Flavobacterium sp.]